MNDAHYETMQRPDCFWFCPTCAEDARRGKPRKSSIGQRDELDIQKMLSNHLEEVNKKVLSLENKIETKLNNYVKDVPEKISKTWAERVDSSQSEKKVRQI